MAFNFRGVGRWPAEVCGPQAWRPALHL